MHVVAGAYPQSTLNGTPTHSSLSGTESYETYVAGQEESGCVLTDLTWMKYTEIIMKVKHKQTHEDNGNNNNKVIIIMNFTEFQFQ